MNPRHWQVCIFAVYVVTGGKLLGALSLQAGKEKHEVPLEESRRG